MSSRVFIADPALLDHRGHHYNLTVAISDALSLCGCEVIWLTNKDFVSTDSEQNAVKIRPSFSVSTYDGHRAKLPQPSNPQTAQPVAEASPATSNRLLSVYRILPASLRRHLTPALRRGIAAMRSTGRKSLQAATPAQQTATPPRQSATPPPRQNPEKLRPEQEIYRALKAFGCTTADHVLFHTSDAHTFRDVVQFFSSLAHVTEWNKFPKFHLSTPYDESIMPHNRGYPKVQTSVMRLRNLGLIDTRVFLHAENERLAEHLSEHFGARVTALPIPAFDVPQTPKRSDNTMNVVYLGAARTEKGFCAIPEFVRDVLSIRPAINIHFYIQITPQILGYTPDVAEAVNQLRLLEERRVTLIENPLSSDGYRSMLSLADVMLLMYEPDRYRVRSSGLAVEAVLSQASVLARADTFPAHLAGPSGIALENGDDPRDALQKLYVEWPYYSVKAQERRSWYLRNHSPEIFTDQILSRRGSFVQDYIVPGAYRYESANAWKRLL